MRVKTRLKSVPICAIILFSVMDYATAVTWTTLDMPGAIETMAYGVSGRNIVGHYVDAAHNNGGFFYDGATWNVINFPGAYSTYANSIDGSNIVGGYQDNSGHYHGFLYDGYTWTPLNMPGATDTYANGIDGDNIVGEYYSSGWHGFLYDGITWSTLDFPDATNTVALGISGKNVVGYFNWGSFLYDGSTYIIPPVPGQTNDIEGNNIVGVYDEDAVLHGFFYDGLTWTPLNAPHATETIACGISGNNIVGYYYGNSGYEHGFIYTIPEPATLFLLTLACPFLLRGRPRFTKVEIKITRNSAHTLTTLLKGEEK